MRVVVKLLGESKDERAIRLVALAYLGAMTLAEALTTVYDPRLGLVLHGVLLVSLLFHVSRTLEHPIHELLLSLAFGPLIRLMSLSLPLAQVPRTYWYLITSVPLFVAAFVVIRTLGLPRKTIGMNWGRVPTQLLFSLSGLVLGYAEYRILRPQPLAKSLTWQEAAIPALILLVSTGFMEELIFRGVMQRVAMKSLGPIGLTYVAAVFGILHIGHQSLVDIFFVFGAGLLFGWVVVKTGSLLGVTLAHGLTNIMLFIVLPLLPALDSPVAPFDLGTPIPARIVTAPAAGASATLMVGPTDAGVAHSGTPDSVVVVPATATVTPTPMPPATATPTPTATATGASSAAAAIPVATACPPALVCCGSMGEHSLGLLEGRTVYDGSPGTRTDHTLPHGEVQLWAFDGTFHQLFT